MSEKENVHAGHRERTIQKLLNNPSIFSDHELLEVLLFYVIPRKDTNALAHKILSMFGDFETLLSATPASLMKVKGVGKKVAAELVVIFQILKRLNEKKPQNLILNNKEKVDAYLIEEFADKINETFVMLMLDRKLRLKGKVRFTDQEKFSVKADIPEVVSAIEMYEPVFAIIAHNHPGGEVTPSEEDDFSTMKINLLCELHGVDLVDHVIVSGKNTFSYRHVDKMQSLKDSARLNKLFSKVIKENKNDKS